MADDIVDQGFATDVVAIFDSSFNQVLAAARPLRALVREPSLIADHPLESGQIISDYKVILPVSIDIPIIVDPVNYRDTYSQIKSFFQSSELLTVQTRAGIYENMVIQDPSHEETPQYFDVLTMQLHLRQVQIVDPDESFEPADPTMADTVKRGEQSGTQATDSQIVTVTNANGTTQQLQPNAGVLSGLDPVPIGSNAGGGSTGGGISGGGTSVINTSGATGYDLNQGTAVVNGVATMSQYQGANTLTGFNAGAGY